MIICEIGVIGTGAMIVNPLAQIDRARQVAIILGKPSENSVKFQQRYRNSHRIFHNLLCSKIFGISPAPKIDSCLVGQFWGLNTFRILQARPPKSRTLPECVTSRGLSDAQIQLISGHESEKEPGNLSAPSHWARSNRRPSDARITGL